MKQFIKKILKIACAAAAVLLILFAAFVGIIIYDSENASNPDSAGPEAPEVSAPEIESASESEYVDAVLINELHLYKSPDESIPVTIRDAGCERFVEEISNDNNFAMAEYYGLDETLSFYRSANINKTSASTLLDDSGDIDSEKLYHQVIKNNEEYMDDGKNAVNAFYTDLSSEEISNICNLISRVINEITSGQETAFAANTLSHMTMFQRTGSASNAYVNDNLTLVFNPTMTEMYGNMSEITGAVEKPEDAKTAVLVHEIMHLLQYGASDGDISNGIEAGMCRMYNVPGEDELVKSDCLWNTWLLEASAELKMASYLDMEPGTYGKKISYVKSYNLSRFNDLNLETHGLEAAAFTHSLEDAFALLKLDTEEEQTEFLKFMYSVEITQTDPDDFWEIYTEKSGEAPSDEEKTAIRMNIRTDAVQYLACNFYRNLAQAVSNGSISDLNTVFYMMRLWELDAYGHLEYTKTAALSHAENYILWQYQVQQQFFQLLSEGCQYTSSEIEDKYYEFYMQSENDGIVTDNCSLGSLSNYNEAYILAAKEKYSSGKFSRISDMASYLKSN